ncbi:transposase [Sinorhizobium sp. BJ1]|uniref:IS66 family transposase n=1 Tax=Sinorhizobium sp. BJ1 TaxID=2035455 RepID=UPI0032AFEFDC
MRLDNALARGRAHRFIDDGRIEIDSNTVERSIRPIANVDSSYPSSSSIWKH